MSCFVDVENPCDDCLGCITDKLEYVNMGGVKDVRVHAGEYTPVRLPRTPVRQSLPKKLEVVQYSG